MARAYVDAGSQVIITNTFGATRLMLQRHGLADKVAEINRAGVEISRRAAAGRAKVFASMGPSGVMLLMGEIAKEELAEAFSEQARALAEAGPDAIVVETMSDLAEAKLAVAAARDTGLPVVACMTFSQQHRKAAKVPPSGFREQLKICPKTYFLKLFSILTLEANSWRSSTGIGIMPLSAR